MRGLLIGLFVAAGCYQPAVQSGVPCSTQGECPDGQSCVAGFCSLYSATAPDAAPVGPADRDRDGVLDDRDNCPDASNAEQINEDGDRLGDACDSCPHLSDTASPDSDGDGIVDACDPNPGTRDSRWLFEGFHAGVPQWPASLGWAASGDGDTIRVTAAGNANTSEYLTLPLASSGRTSFENFTASVSLTIDQTSGTSPEVGFFVGDTGTNGDLDCTLYSGGQLAFYDPRADHSTQVGWQTGTPYTLTIARRGTTYTCSVAGPTLQKSVTMTSQVVPNGASIGLWAYGATARLDWVFVAGSP